MHKSHKIYNPITATHFTCSNNYMEFVPCDALKSYIRCFWGTKKPVNQEKTYSKTNGIVTPDTCMDIMFQVDDFNELIQAGEIVVLDDKKFEESKINSNINQYNEKEIYISEKLTNNNNFKCISQLDNEILNKKGFYCIRLKEKSKLPNRYQSILEVRKYKFIYIGKAEKTLRQRLEQELEHKSAGTF